MMMGDTLVTLLCGGYWPSGGDLSARASFVRAQYRFLAVLSVAYTRVGAGELGRHAGGASDSEGAAKRERDKRERTGRDAEARGGGGRADIPVSFEWREANTFAPRHPGAAPSCTPHPDWSPGAPATGGAAVSGNRNRLIVTIYIVQYPVINFFIFNSFIFNSVSVTTHDTCVYVYLARGK